MAATATAPQLDGPLIYVARRTGVRRSRGGRGLLLWRLAYEDITGHCVESRLVAVTLEPKRTQLDARHADWSDASLLALVSHQGEAWRGMVDDTVRRFTATRLSRERAIAAAATASANPIQAGLFDRRTERARFAQIQSGANLAEQVAARAKTVASAGALSAHPPELLLVLIPRDAARM